MGSGSFSNPKGEGQGGGGSLKIVVMGRLQAVAKWLWKTNGPRQQCGMMHGMSPLLLSPSPLPSHVRQAM